MARFLTICFRRVLFGAFVLLGFFFPTLWLQAAPENLHQIVSVARVEGKGAAMIRRAKGTEVVATVGDRLFAGDKIITDASTSADLILHDGTIVRVGMNTDYKVEAIEQEKPGLWSWAFEMTAGSIRALVEKSQQKGFVKFKVNTPSGTMGVRGTEIVLTEKNGTLELVTLHGEALLGPPRADFRNLQFFKAVGAGMRSSIRRGEKQALDPARFTFHQLLRERREDGKELVDNDRQALFGLKKKLSSDTISDEESKKILAKAQDDFAKAKDALGKKFETENSTRISSGGRSSGSTSGDPVAKSSVPQQAAVGTTSEPTSAVGLSGSRSNSVNMSGGADMAPAIPKNNIDSLLSDAKPIIAEAPPAPANNYAPPAKGIAWNTAGQLEQNPEALPSPIHTGVAETAPPSPEGGANTGVCFVVFYERQLVKSPIELLGKHGNSHEREHEHKVADKYVCVAKQRLPVDCSPGMRAGTTFADGSSECKP